MWMDKPEREVMAEEVVAVLVQALPMLIIPYKVDRAELAAVVAAAELTNRAQQLQMAAILLAAAEAVVEDLLTVLLPQVDLI